MKAVFLVVAIFITSQAWSNICSEENADLDRFKHELAELRAKQVQVDQKIERHEEAVDQQCQPSSSNDPTQPLPEGDNSWQAALDPHIPEQAGTVSVISRTDITSVLLPDDGTPACTYLKCNRSHVGLHDWVGWSFDTTNGVIRLIAMGGHADLGANTVYELDITSLSWTRVHDYDQPAEPFPDLSNHDPDEDGINECVPLKDGPFGAHTYDGLVHIPTIGSSLMVRSSGYSPNWDCTRDYDLYPANMWLWSDAGGWTDTGIGDWAFPKTAYDAARDKVYIASESGGDDRSSGLWEVNPHTMEWKKLASFWNGKGGAMDFDPETRELWVYGRGSGLYTIHIAEDGTHSDINKVVKAGNWWDDAFNAGLAVSKGIAVGWKGNNHFMHYNSQTGQVEEIVASGDISETRSRRVLGKFDAVPGRPGVFIGMSGNWGVILYKAF